MIKFGGRCVLVLIAALGLGLGCGDDIPEENSGEPGGDPGGKVSAGKADTAFANDPLYITGAFDGSKTFKMWVETMVFAREMERDYGIPLKFSYFINSCYFDRTVTGSWIGTAQSREEEIVRWALAQQAINEGHEIANHSVRHRDGSEFSVEEWRKEFQQFHDLTDANLFETVLDATGRPVFPAWRPMPDAAPRDIGAACAANDDCDSSWCLALTPEQSFCTQGCNRHKPCTNGTICGAPDWNQSIDSCIPMPEFPIEHDGQLLFDSLGNPNLSHPALKPYVIDGFRAPQLGHNSALFQVMEEFGYRYDTSKILSPGPPARTKHGGRTFTKLYQFALMRYPGSRTIPMDYNYKVNTGGTGERMLADYQNSIVKAYEKRRMPWNIGHHFALWKGGAYWTAMKDTFRFAAKGCPDGAGTRRCEEVAFPSFRQLADILDAKTDGREDGLTGDIFLTDDPQEGIAPDADLSGTSDEEAH